MPLTPGSSQAVISENIREMSKNHPHDVAVAAALSNARRHPHNKGGIVCRDVGGYIDKPIAHLAGGGPPSAYWLAQMSNPAHPSNYGLLNSPGGAAGGRTDTLPHVVAADSYVIPADVVSGMGEGDTLSGARAIEAMLRSMPYGVSAPSSRGGRGLPSAPAPVREQAKGGASKGHSAVPVIVANGEMTISPDDVRRIGDGNIKRGHRVLDAFVKHVRKRTIKDLKGLPEPVK